MSFLDRQNAEPIDAVITWVDGADPAHQAKRQHHQQNENRELHENAINPHRWACSDEILYCLQSIENHAPWLRKLWIVTDNQQPDLSSLPYSLTNRISIVDHQDLFRGYSGALPTFNSLSIESLLWRIEGLSERFIYFNDDVFLTAPTSPESFFDGMRPVLRGAWADYSFLESNTHMLADPALFAHCVELNAARMAGFEALHVFASAHVVHPMRRSVLAGLFDCHLAAFETNIAHRFRDLSQFLTQGLYNHIAIANGSAIIQTEADHLHLASGAGAHLPPDAIRALLRQAASPETRLLCVNDLPQLEVTVPDARKWIARAIAA